MSDPISTLRQLLIKAPNNATAGGTMVVIDLDTQLDHTFAPWVQMASLYLYYSFPSDALTARLKVS